jgi:hypothetical protein
MARVPLRPSVVAGERFPKTRRLPRYSITALAEVTEPVSRKSVSGWTSLISDTGCHVRATDPLDAGTIVQLRLQQKGIVFQTRARVADALPAEGMGLAFFDTEPSQRDILKRWMADAAVQE